MDSRRSAPPADKAIANIFQRAQIGDRGGRAGQYLASGIREHLECALVGDAVRYIDATSLRELTEIIESQEESAADGRTEPFYEHDEAFHDAIARLSRYVGVWTVIRQTKIHFDRVRHLSLVLDADHIPLLIEQHREILQALANCNEGQAVAAMRRHLREVFRRSNAVIAQQESLTKLRAQAAAAP